MHPLAAPGTLWVLSSDGKYLVRPQADETSHKKQTACGRQEKGLPFFSRITKDFASAEATRGLSDRPLDPFGAHPCMRGRNLPQETAFLRQARERAYLAFPYRKGFRLSGGDQGAFRSPFRNLGPSLRMGDSARNRFLVAGRKRACLAFHAITERLSPQRRRSKGLSWTPSEAFGPVLRMGGTCHKKPLPCGRHEKGLPFPLLPSGPHLQNLTQAAEPLPPGAFHRLSLSKKVASSGLF